MNKKKIEIFVIIVAFLLIFAFWHFIIKEIREFKIDHQCYMMTDEKFFNSEQCKSYWIYRQVGKK